MNAPALNRKPVFSMRYCIHRWMSKGIIARWGTIQADGRLAVSQFENGVVIDWVGKEDHFQTQGEALEELKKRGKKKVVEYEGKIKQIKMALSKLPK